MKIYSQAYAHAPILMDHLQQAKSRLADRSQTTLHRVIDAAEARSAGKPINILKTTLGLKVSTPIVIQALNDLYIERVAPQNGHGVADPTSSWAAARLYANSRPILMPPILKKESGHKSAALVGPKAKAVRFAVARPAIEDL